MPRHGPVDYPPVPTSNLSLPPSIHDPSRYSYSRTPTNITSKREVAFTAALNAQRAQQAQSPHALSRQISGLAVLPADSNHISAQQPLPRLSQVPLPSQKRDLKARLAQQEEERARLEAQERFVTPSEHNTKPWLQVQNPVTVVPSTVQALPQQPFSAPQIQPVQAQYAVTLQSEAPIYPALQPVVTTVQSKHHAVPQSYSVFPTSSPSKPAQIIAPAEQAQSLLAQTSSTTKSPGTLPRNDNAQTTVSPIAQTQPTTTTVTTQPAQTAPMSFAPPTAGPPSFPAPSKGGSWRTSLFSCASPSVCLTSLICPCIVFGRTQQRLNQKSASLRQDSSLSSQLDTSIPASEQGSFMNGSCIAWAGTFLCGIASVLTVIQHRRMRKMYAIEDVAEGGSALLDDLVRGCCCCCCLLAVDEREARWREQRTTTKSTEKGYEKIDEMRFKPS